MLNKNFFKIKFISSENIGLLIFNKILGVDEQIKNIKIDRKYVIYRRRTIGIRHRTHNKLFISVTMYPLKVERMRGIQQK